ncbi:DUF4030 domain-containing protein, partial [Bacillus sp. D-CC]
PSTSFSILCPSSLAPTSSSLILVFGQVFDDIFRKNGYEGFGIQQINYKKNQPVTIDIKTKISDDEVGARELGQRIEKEVEGVLKTGAV